MSQNSPKHVATQTMQTIRNTQSEMVGIIASPIIAALQAGDTETAAQKYADAINHYTPTFPTVEYHLARYIRLHVSDAPYMVSMNVVPE